MILELEDILRSRLQTQLGMHRADRRFLSLGDALEQAWWIYGEYGLTSRMRSATRAPLKRLSDEIAVRIPIGRAYRLMHKNTVRGLVNGYQSPVQDMELFDVISAGGISRQQLAENLAMSVRKLNYRLRKEQNNWQIIKLDDRIVTTDDYLSDTSIDTDETILRVLDRYPYCNVDQLELLTGLSKDELAAPLSRLNRDKKIIRGITRVNAPDEIFTLPEHEPVDQYEDFPVCVFERRDALVEMISLERYFETKENNYWIFLDGLPQAEFDLDKASGSSYEVKNLSRFLTTTYELGNILDEIRSWGKSQKLEIIIDRVDTRTTAVFKRLGQLLLDRGYDFKDDRLVLDRYQKRPPGIIDEKEFETDEIVEKLQSKPQVLDWRVLGPWCKNRQLLDYSGMEAEVIYSLGQLDSIESIAYRLSRNPQRLWFDDVVYIPGINFRMGFVHKDDIEDIVRGWPKQIKFGLIDKKIIGFLDEPKTTDDILQNIGESPMTVKQRLRYLEQSRVIRKQLPGSLHMDKCLWITFDTDIPDYKKPVGGKRAMASVGTFLMRTLQTNPPLTKDQISRFLGMSIRELEPLLTQYLRTQKIIEGYFVANISEIQYSLAEVLDTITTPEKETLDRSASTRVDILPFNDPFSMLHLPQLVLNDPSIQPTQRYDETAEQWMITWDGAPVGYFIKQPTMQQLIDYVLEIKITEDMQTTPIIAGALQKIVTLFRTWYGDEGKLTKINGTPASDDKWREIHFMLESIGIVYN